MNERFGRFQRQALVGLEQHGSWPAEIRWVIGNHSISIRTFESLERRGYVRMERLAIGGSWRHCWTLTNKGRDMAIRLAQLKDAVTNTPIRRGGQANSV